MRLYRAFGVRVEDIATTTFPLGNEHDVDVGPYAIVRGGPAPAIGERTRGLSYDILYQPDRL
jgi:hypothetical protein